MDYHIFPKLTDSQVIQLHEMYQGEWWSRGRTLDEVRTVLAFSDYTFAVCNSSSDELVAFARVLTDRVFKALIFDVIVHPEHRSRGVGQFLLREVINHPDLAPVQHIELYCRPDKVTFYENLGFTADLGAIQLMRKNRG